MSDRSSVIIILGPTGVGKTGAAIIVARSLGSEIISADSMQIYRHMDIGTAKPSPEQMNEVKHHMIDIVDPSEEYSAGKYIEQIVPIIEGLHGRERVPVLVGGTGLYIKAMTRGLFEAPDTDWDLREELLAVEKDRPGALYEKLKTEDPIRAEQLVPTDIRRVIRALEVCMRSGKAMSELHKEKTRPLSYNYIKIGLTRDRGELYEMIDKRVDMMIELGLIDEVRNIMTLNPARTPLQAIGYKEMMRYIEGEIDIEEAIRLIKRDSRRYAKRQYTWFRKEEGIHWIDISGITDDETVGIMVMNKIKERS